MRMVTCICVAESLLCFPEVSTTVLISYMPILNKKLNKIHHVQIPETYRKESHKPLDRYAILIWDKYYTIHIWKKRIQALVEISSMRLEPERSENIFPKLDENNCQLQILYLVNYPFELKGERKNFLNKVKLREFVSSRTILKNFSKESKIEKELRF